MALAVVACLGIGALAGLGAAQQRSLAGVRDVEEKPYDGRFAFARIRFGTSDFRAWGRPPWSHDYPLAERNLMQIVDEISKVRPQLEGRVLDLDDPELFRYPFAYICEVGYWNPSPAEIQGLRDYLLKGGFLIVDDFRGGDWSNFIFQMRRVLPGAQPVELDLEHPVFRAFFHIDNLDFPAPYGGLDPVYLGIFEDNDPEGRLMMVINYNNDIGEFWEYAGTGRFPVGLTNEGFKLGVNYIVYSMTH